MGQNQPIGEAIAISPNGGEVSATTSAKDALFRPSPSGTIKYKPIILNNLRPITRVMYSWPVAPKYKSEQLHLQTSAL